MNNKGRRKQKGGTLKKTYWPVKKNIAPKMIIERSFDQNY